jgi:hypothetical protein
MKLNRLASDFVQCVARMLVASRAALPIGTRKKTHGLRVTSSHLEAGDDPLAEDNNLADTTLRNAAKPKHEVVCTGNLTGGITGYTKTC